VIPSIVSLLFASALYAVVSWSTTVTPAVAILSGIVITVAHGVIVLSFGGIEQEEIMLVLSFEERFGIDLGPFKRIAKRLI